jgi:hypothetical protein
MARTLSPSEVLSRVRHCEESLDRLTSGGTQFERAVWLNTKHVISQEASNIRPTDRGVACLLDTAAGALGGFLLAPPENLYVIKDIVGKAVREASLLALVQARLHAVK